MATKSPNAPWVLNKKVLAHAPESNVSCIARLRICHNKITKQGSISIRVDDIGLANSINSRRLMLNFRPQQVESFEFAPLSNHKLCPPHLLSKIPAEVNDVSGTSTLSLKVNAAGDVILPSDLTPPINPGRQGDPAFDAFAKICRSTLLRIHLAKRQFMEGEADELRKFLRALNSGLQTEPFDLGRHGVVSGDWRIFGLLPDPPQYCEPQADPPPCYEKSPPSQSGEKRRWNSRDSSTSPHSGSQKRPHLQSPPPLGSPTEVITPSALSTSPANIRPTWFHGSFPGCKGLDNNLEQTEYDPRGLSVDKICEFIQDQLRCLSDDKIREVLVQSGRQYLLAMPGDALEKVPLHIDGHMKNYIDETIDRHIQPHIDSAVESALGQFKVLLAKEVEPSKGEILATVSEEFEAHLEDKTLDLHQVCDDSTRIVEECGNQYISNIEDLGNKQISDMDERVLEYENALRRHARKLIFEMERKGAKIEESVNGNVTQSKRECNGSTLCLCDSACPRSGVHTSKRRSSI